jgi:hypothetical protein
MRFTFFKRQQPSEEVGDAFRGPGIPEAHNEAFSQIVDHARRLFGTAVKADSLMVEPGHLPAFRVGDLSMVGTQWIVVDVKEPTGSRYALRLELDWEDGVPEAIAVLEAYQARQLLAPTPGDVLTARVIALVGDTGEVTVSTVQAEFSHVIAIQPLRKGAVRFNINVTTGFVVVLESPDLGWWTFGGNFDDDGTIEAFRVVEHLVLRGGTVRSTRRSSKLFHADGSNISGPHKDGIRMRHSATAEFLPYEVG